MEESYWQRLRDEVLLDPGSTNLNAGSFSPLRRAIFDAVTLLRREQASNPSNFHWRRTPGLLEAARLALASYLNTPTANLLLLPNATFGINLVTRSLHIPAGGEILTTDHEYGAMISCWHRLAKHCNLSIRTVELPQRIEAPTQIIEAIEAGITSATRVLFISHVTSPTGLVFPVRELCQLARTRGILSVVDGAHAPGMLPLDLTELGADFYAGNCHKWLMAPAGSGFLYAAAACRQQLEPLITSWGWGYPEKFADEDSGWGNSFWARNLEFHGTIDRCATLILPEVLDDRRRIGEEAIFERTRFLCGYARSRLGELGFQPVYTPTAEFCSSMLAVETPPVEPIRARDWLWHQHQIEAPFTTVGGRSFLRVSTAWFNTPAEIERLADVMAVFPFGQMT
jgi:isopenicillin-N epimerase